MQEVVFFIREVKDNYVLGGDTYMTSVLRGVTQYVTNTTDRLRECVTKGGVLNPENFADVIKVSPLLEMVN